MKIIGTLHLARTVLPREWRCIVRDVKARYTYDLYGTTLDMQRRMAANVFMLGHT